MAMFFLMDILGEHCDPHHLRSNTLMDVFPPCRNPSPTNLFKADFPVHELAAISAPA